jgi:hypothetical protein
MIATTLLVLMFGVFAVLLLNVALRIRSTAPADAIASGSTGDAAWMPVVFSDDGDGDCSGGDAGSDGGGD